MKKIVSVIVLFLTTGVFSFANSPHQNITQKVTRTTANALASRPNSGAINENIALAFGIKDFYGEIVSPDYGVKCKAYALHKNWLLIAGTCAYPMDVYDEVFGSITPTSHEIYSYKKGMHLTFNERVMLVQLDKARDISPLIKVLATSSPKKLFTLATTHTLKINTSRFGLNAVRDRQLKKNSVTKQQGKHLFQLQDEGKLIGTSTDPLFLIAPNTNEFLAAYNNGDMDYTSRPYGVTTWQGLGSHDWYTLTLEDLYFIKNTIQEKRPQDWQTVRTRLFYDNTTTPYFAK